MMLKSCWVWSHLFQNFLVFFGDLLPLLLFVVLSLYLLDLFEGLLNLILELVCLSYHKYTFAWYMFIWAASSFIFLVLVLRDRCRAESFSAVSSPGCLFMIYRIYWICFCFWWTKTSFSTTCSVLNMSLFWRVLIFSFISYESGSVPSKLRHRWTFKGF